MESHYGEILAFLCAFVWAVAVIYFRKIGEVVKPLALNFFKNSLATVLFAVTLPLMGEAILRPASFRDYAIVLISGTIGIAFADTIFFRSLNLLGAGLSAIVDCLYSPFVIIFAFLFLEERLGFPDFVGGVLIITGILIVSREKGSRFPPRKKLMEGIGLGVVAMFLMAAGIVMVKPVLERQPLLWVAQTRLLAGALVLLVMILFRKDRRKLMGSLKPSQSWKTLIPGSFLGAYVAMILWVGGFKYAKAGVAAILNQTSALMILPLAAIFLGEPFTARRAAAVVLAMAGVICISAL